MRCCPQAPAEKRMPELLTMHGHGAYVWSAYGVFALAMLIDAWLPLAQRRRVLRELRARLRRAQTRNAP